jgi:deoxyribodipyrimidine photolyase-related protein
MSEFARRLARFQPKPGRRRWLFVPYDQLSDEIGPLSREPAESLGIVVVENPWKAARRPYHRQKLAWILINLRWFALEQAERGVAVRHVVADGPYRSALEPLAKELGTLQSMRPAERELRADLEPLVQRGLLEYLPHEGWLTTDQDFDSACAEPPWRMDAFYRGVRRRTGVLMQKGKPIGGKFSFDAENRRRWDGAPVPPIPPTFPLDPIKQEVGALIEKHFAHHPGRLDLAAVAGTKAQAEEAWAWAREQCLTHFGPFEDAMSVHSSTLFHTKISTLLNLHRLTPRRVIDDVLAMESPLASKEGFIRQVLGWREFVHHIHERTDGFRATSVGGRPISLAPGDGGFERWSGSSWPLREGTGDPDGGAAPNFLEAEAPLPPAYWGTISGLRCLDHVVGDVWREGYSHHITRLMVLSNLATLLGVSPRELTDWFWIAYTDAFDWVVEPNVLAMGSFAVGELMTTKPYIAGAPYIHRMSDYCEGCAFDPKKNCPITPMYWAFLDRHKDRLAGNQRIAMPLRSLEKRTDATRREDRRITELVQITLREGKKVTPQLLSQ